MRKEGNTGAQLTKVLVFHGLSCKVPAISTLKKQLSSGVARATDGCKVEPDGTCPHQHKSWLLELGFM